MSVVVLPERGWVTRHGSERRLNDLVGKPALFLDRDGTVVENVPYLNNPARVSLIPGVREAILAFRDKGYAIIIVTNQSGVARGLISREQYLAVEAAVIEALGLGQVDATYACPYVAGHPWRKPEPGMLLAAAQDFALSLTDSTMIGDTMADVIAGAQAGVARIVHVLTGHGQQERAQVEAWACEREREGVPHVRFASSLGELVLAEVDR